MSEIKFLAKSTVEISLNDSGEPSMTVPPPPLIQKSSLDIFNDKLLGMQWVCIARRKGMQLWQRAEKIME
jgi:hypothetical protein